MSNVDQTKVNAAIRKCLEKCYESNDALTQVATFIAGIQAAGGWNRDEIRAIEIAVHKVLQGMVASPFAPDETANQPHGDGERGGSETTRLNGV